MALIKSINGISPQFGEEVYLAENATVVGDVVLGKHCSVWFNAVVRGDVHYIRMGDKVNIQDGAVIHCTFKKHPTEIGNNVSIGHNALVHGCTVMDNVLIGMGAIIMHGAIINSNSIIAAGAVVLAGTSIGAGELWAGVPAKCHGPVSEELKAHLSSTADRYVEYASWF